MRIFTYNQKMKHCSFFLLMFAPLLIQMSHAGLHSKQELKSTEQSETKRTPISQTGAQLDLVQYIDPKNPEKLIEYGVVEMFFRSAIGQKRVKSIKLEVPSFGKTSGNLGKTHDIVIENPDLSKGVKFKIDPDVATILWTLHKKKLTFPTKVLLEGENQYSMVPQENDIKIGETKTHSKEILDTPKVEQ